MMPTNTFDVTEPKTTLRGRIELSGRVEIGIPGHANAVFTVAASGTPATSTLLITFTRNTELLTSDLTADEITLSSHLTKGALTKIDASTYTLAVTAKSAGTGVLTIAKTNVTANPATFTVRYTVPPAASTGWYGTWLPNSDKSFSDVNASFVSLNGTTEITGSKRNLSISTQPNQSDWEAIKPAPPIGYNLWDDVGYKIVVLVKGTAWGQIQVWDSTGAVNMTTSFTPISVTVDGTVYSGLVSSGVLGAPTPVLLKFV